MAKRSVKKEAGHPKTAQNHKRKKAPTKKREKARYPGLDKSLFSRIKQEYHDFDYIDKLGPKEKQWLSDFNQEWLGANITDSKTKMHKSWKRQKQVYDMNNARNRDILSNARAGGLLDELPSGEGNGDIDPMLYEDAFLETLDIDQETLEAFMVQLNGKLKDPIKKRSSPKKQLRRQSKPARRKT